MNRLFLVLGISAFTVGAPLESQSVAPDGPPDTLPLRYKPVANRLPIGIGDLAAIQVAPPFVYVGGQRFILGGSADAEQHLFVVADSSKTVQRLYWIQIESLLPTRPGAYNYAADSTASIQSFALAVNRRVYTTGPAPLSDRARAFGLVESAGYRIPVGGSRVRFVYLPEERARREVMIIYLELGAGAERAASGIVLERRPGAARTGDSLAVVRRELTARYAENEAGFFARDPDRVMRLRHPDFHTITPDGNVSTREQMYERTRAFIARIERFDSLTEEITALTLAGDTAHAIIRQRTVRQQRLGDGMLREVRTSVVQRESWIRTGAEWLFWRVDQIQPGETLVDGRPLQ